MSEGDQQAPQRSRRRHHRVMRAITRLLLATGACVILLVVVALLALPAVEKRPQLLGRWLGEYVEQEVTLREFEIAWSGGAPLLRIRGLEMASGNEPGGALRLDLAEVRVDLARSLLEFGLRPRAVIVRGAKVMVARAANGAFTVEGFGQSSSTSVDEALTDLLAVLPANAVLGIEQATVTVNGLGTQPDSAQPLVLHPVSAHLRHGNNGVRLSAKASIRDFPDSPIHSTLQWQDRKSSLFSASDFTLNTEALPISVLPDHLRPVGVQGQISFALDGQIAGHALQTMRGMLKLDHIGTGRDLATPQITAIQSLVEYVHDDVGWQLTLLRLHTRLAGEISTPSTLVFNGKLSTAPHTAVLDHLPISTLLPVMHVFSPDSDLITRSRTLLSPAGRVENLQLDLDGGLSSIRLRKMRMQVRDLVVKSAQHNLEIAPLHASLVVEGSRGSIDIENVPIRLDLGADGQTKAHFTGDGTLRWRQGEEELVVDSDGVNLTDGELRMKLSGAVRIPQDSTTDTTLDLQLSGVGLGEPSIKRYLARNLLPAPLTEWLSGSIIAGQITDFSARIAGSPTSAAEMAELLELKASFINTSLRYQNDWPDITAMNGQFALSGRQFSLDVDDAISKGARIDSTRGEIADVLDERPVLTLQGRVAGRAEHGVAFVKATPLARKFAPLMQQLSAKGEATLALNLTIPLFDAAIGVRGKLNLKNNKLKIQALRSALQDVNGAIAFDAGGLKNAELKARYLQREISMSLDGMLDKRKRTRLTIDGTTDPQGLLRHLFDVGALDSDKPTALPVIGRLSGRTNWQVALDLTQPGAGEHVITMTVHSDLDGMALDLPAPLGKPMRESRPLKLTSTIIDTDGGDRRFQLHYGDGLHAVLDMTPQHSGEFTLRRGALRLGGGDATLSAQSGVTVRGSIDVISVDDWVTLIASLSNDPDIAGPAYPALKHLRNVQLEAQRVIALDASFDAVTLNVSHKERGPWLISTSGDGIEGTISIADPTAPAPIDAQFKRLHMRHDSAMPAVKESPAKLVAIDAGTVPATRVVVQHLRFNDIEFGLVKLVAEPTASGLALRDILVLNDAFEIRGNGTWVGPVDSAHSSFDLRLHSNDFGQFARAFGYGDSGIEGGAVEIVLNAKWPDSPFDFSLDRVEGELHFRGTGGRLRDVEPGTTGRVFGLFNLPILPRRLLLLDFKDLFEEGVGYDLLEGSIALADGNATSENVIMQTQTAQVEIKGRVGLIAQDYDQVMTVTPKLSASLPLAPIWLAEKLFNRKLIDSAFAYQYIITGTWDEPSVERVRVEVPVTEIN